ncbi:immunoglobulin superfamily member 8 isoform X2 [Rhinatrema bivittatum]|uniref:immunoglobulin superfamily member 8 isoform X2 n=1 Tax=Rhinatrema bivittatum TaxID=194408 RepID=UPI001125C54D|nr:immunoglobulin superfamily member 8 isoform X2 [Rhinatrema bivittatum]
MKGSRVFLLVPVFLAACLAREVHVPQGPLYRVEGTSASIPCNVTEYEGPSLQHFEWFVYRPGAPDISIGIVSTKNPRFFYTVFESRVQSGDVYIHRARGDGVELRIKRLRAEDTGVYECYTPTTDTKYYGSYSHKVELKVIPDLLHVSATSTSPLKGRLAAVSPLHLAMAESKEMQLTCTALTQSQQHTHLAVSFGVSAPDAPVGRQTLKEIIAVRRDFTVEAGTGGLFADRHQSGEVRVEKTGADKYKLVIASLRPEDTGTYHCTAAEWIQDPDGSWQKITEKRSVLAQVNVQAIAAQLAVLAGPAEVHASAGDTLELFCNVTGIASPLPAVVYSVGWELAPGPHAQGRLVAQLSVDGTVVLGQGYSNSETGKRHISLEKLAALPGHYRLRIHAAQPGDLGTYSCTVKAHIRHPNLSLQQAASKTSVGLEVHMQSEAVTLQAYSRLAVSSIHHGETAGLLCNITMETTQSVQVAVSWWAELGRAEQQEPESLLVASVNRAGVMELPERASGGEVSIDRLGPLCYKLRLHGLQQSDEGRYHCAITAWVQYPDQSWYSAASAKSDPITVYPYALGAFVSFQSSGLDHWIFFSRQLASARFLPNL